MHREVCQSIAFIQYGQPIQWKEALWFMEWAVDESLTAATHTITYTIKKSVKLFES